MLAGFENLLSSIHPVTKKTAYGLAAFYAENDRMRDADAVLDWITDKHIQAHGFAHSTTLDHLLKVVEIFRNWSRESDAAAYLERILLAVESRTFPKGPSNNKPENLIVIPDDELSGLGTRNQTSATSQPGLEMFVPPDGPSDPNTLNHHLDMAASGAGGPDAVEQHLFHLIEHCEQYPRELLTHGLRCRTALIQHFERTNDAEKLNEMLDQAQDAFSKLTDSEQPKSLAFFEACIDLIKCFVKAERYDIGDDMFNQIQCDMAESSGIAAAQQINFLERIGLFYQGGCSSSKASSWFQRALVVCYARYGARSEHAKRLETAIEKGYYELYVPKEDTVHPGAELATGTRALVIGLGDWLG